MTVRTRFAPSPTGYLHIGGVRTALFNWAFARRHGGQFILRIDDTDQAREVEGAVKLICDGFRWMGMDWDEGPEVGGPHGPYFQSQRGPKYEAAMLKLIEAGAVYPCFATEKELTAAKDLAKAAKQPFIYRGPTRTMSPGEVMDAWKEKRPAMRFKVPEGQLVKLTDHVRGEVEWRTDLTGDFTIARAGGQPLYNFASIVDDVDMEITHVVRAEEHLSNTLPQLLILEALGGKRPEFAHVPFVAKPGGKQKLSKRDPPPGVMVALSEYEEAGYLPDAIFNALARLGWSLDDKSEIIPRDVIIKNFSLDRITKAPAALDMAKIYWIQDQYMQALPIEEKLEKMEQIVLNHLNKEKALPTTEPTEKIETSGEQPRHYKHTMQGGVGIGGEAKVKLRQLIAASGDRLKLMNDVVRYADYLFREELLYEPKAIKTLQGSGAKEQLERLRGEFANLEPFDAATIEAAAKKVGADLGVGGKINHVLRSAGTGRTVGAGVYEVLAILGKERTLRNFDRTLACLTGGVFPELPE